MYLSKFNKIKAFTLAEILITLSIIGVIASMTIPSLVQDVQDAQYKTAWKKAYADFAQITKRLALNNAGSLKGVFTEAANGGDSFRNPYLSYLNYTKSCNAGSNDCWTENWQLLIPSYPTYDDWRNAITSSGKIILNNGTFIAFNLFTSNCNNPSHSPYADICGRVFFDVNGFKGPNIASKDIFQVYVLKDGNIVPTGKPNYAHNECYSGSTGWGCSAKFLY